MKESRILNANQIECTQFSICSSENNKLKENFYSNFKKVIIMALNDTFNILSIKISELGADLTSSFPIKDYWEEECKESPFKKECLSI